MHPSLTWTEPIVKIQGEAKIGIRRRPPLEAPVLTFVIVQRGGCLQL